MLSREDFGILSNVCMTMLEIVKQEVQYTKKLGAKARISLSLKQVPC